jgi:excisionase family DNA binding protein
MQNYLTPEEVAQLLKVDATEILPLIEQGKLRAIRIGNNIRIPEPEVEKLLVTCAAGSILTDAPGSPATELLSGNSRMIPTRTGRATFRAIGSVEEGVEIWPGKMRYPIRFPKSFMDALLLHFGDREVAVGGSFDGPLPGSLGEFIQRELKTKMNPAVYVAALLIKDGYAAASRRGYIRFRRRPRKTANSANRVAAR